MSNNSELQANSIDLKAILDAVNSLPTPIAETWTLTYEDGSIVEKVVYID